MASFVLNAGFLKTGYSGDGSPRDSAAACFSACFRSENAGLSGKGGILEA